MTRHFERIRSFGVHQAYNREEGLVAQMPDARADQVGVVGFHSGVMMEFCAGRLGAHFLGQEVMVSVAIHPEELGRQRMVQHLYRPAPVGAVPARRVTAQNVLLRGVVKDFNFRREALHFRNRFVDRRGGCRGVIVLRGMPNASSPSPLVAGMWSSSLSLSCSCSCARSRSGVGVG